MATIIPFPTRHRLQTLGDRQLDALREGLMLLGSHHAARFPRLSAVIAEGAITDEPRPLNGPASQNVATTSVSPCA
jgi:hypothetical protein